MSHSHNHNHDSLSCCHNKPQKDNIFIKIVKSKILFGSFLTIAIFYLVSNLVVTAPNINAGAFEDFILNKWIWFGVTTAVVLLYSDEYVEAYWQLISKRKIDMHILLGIAAHSLYAYSVVMLFTGVGGNDQFFWHGILVLILLTEFGHILEHSLEDKALKEFKDLTNKKVPHATLKVGDNLKEVDINSVKSGDILVFRKGEFISFDGILISDNATFDTSSITGESVPKNVYQNEEITSGYICFEDYIEMKVLNNYQNSTFNKIIQKMEEISQRKPKIQRISERISKIFVPALLIIGLITFATWSLITQYGHPTINGSAGKAWYQNGLKATMTVIAVACPCAFGIIVPLSLSITIGEIYKNQIFTNSPILLEKDLKITDVCLDKTGTLTTGNMKLINFSGDDKYLPIIKSIEAKSSHPIAKGIVSSLQKEKILKVTKFKESAGKGVFGVIDGHSYELIASEKIHHKSLKLMSPISTRITLLENDKVIGVLEVEDELKKDAKSTVSELINQGLNVHMVTGDNKETAQYIADKLGIKSVIAGVKPIEKYNFIKKLKAEGKRVMYVGDGINDIVAMEEADISASFSTENSVINNHADTVLVSKKTKSILNIIMISKKSIRNIKSLFAWAIGYNIILIPLAATMTFDPWVSAITMSSSDVILMALALSYKIRLSRSMYK